MRRTDPDFPDAPTPSDVHLLDARLHLLDRQIIDADGEPVGIVDDLEVDGRPGADAAVTAIITGQALFTRIFGGVPPRGQLKDLPWHLVAKVGTSVHLVSEADTSDGQWVEHWLRDRIIRRIPGGRHATE